MVHKQTVRFRIRVADSRRGARGRRPRTRQWCCRTA